MIFEQRRRRRVETMNSYFVGLDGGGSKTSAIVVDGSMNVFGEGHSGPSNFLRVGIEEATHNLSEAITQATIEAGIGIDDVELAWCGIAGFDHPLHGRQLQGAMRKILPKGNFRISTDAQIALTAAFDHETGIVLIAGTGSVAFGRNSEGHEARAGGWGHILGDEGSGYSVVRFAMRAVMKAWDGRGPETRMSELFCEELGVSSPRDLPVIVYAPSTHSDKIASFLRIVAQAAEEGDEIAKEIFDREGRELGTMVIAVARKLGMTGSVIPLACVGGAFHAGDLLLEPLKRVIEAAAAGVRFVSTSKSPVEGAAEMAIQAAALQTK